MPRAFCLIRRGPEYRSEAFHAGLKACGYSVVTTTPAKFAPGDLLVIWNRYGDGHAQALRAESAGAPVIVAENAYIWTGGVSPHHLKARPAYALARSWHNDSTVIPTGGPERWNALGVDLKPWRTDGGHVLVCPNRPFGVPGRMMPSDWANDVRRRLQKLTKREIRVRPHPGNDPPRKPLAEDLAGAWAMVIWSSSAGVHSLIAGVPVICEAPAWICKGAAYGGLAADVVADFWMHLIEKARPPALHRLAHAQYSVDEIASGHAFRAVLGC